jgi:hypothetical protein
MRQATQLLAPTAASVADATLFTTSGSGVTIIRSIVIANTDTVNRTFSLAFGGTAATAANCIASGVTVLANTTTILYGPFVLPASTAVHGLASATAVTFSASGELSVAGG